MTVTRLRRTVGGSDAAAACGIDPYRSQVAAWLELTGRVKREPSEAMRWGTLIEPLVYRALEDDGYDLMPAPAEGFRDHDRPWLTGHPDGFVALDGAMGVLEVKTAGAWQRGKWDEAIPVHYVAQTQIYLHLTGCDLALVACLIAGQTLEVRTLHRDERSIGLMLDLMETFWGYVQRDQPPPPDGSASAREALLSLYPRSRPASKYRLSADEFRALQELRARKEQARVIADQIAALENGLRAAMGDNEVAISPHDTPEITYRTVESSRLDVAALKDALPTIYREYLRTTTTRRFSA